MLVGIDFAQLEWRVAMELGNDSVAIQEIKDGQDTHTLNQQTFELPSRLIAKIYLFRTIFRGTGYGFAHDPAFSHVSSDPKYWDAVNDKFFEKYQGINRWHQQMAQQVIRGEPIRTPFGRQWTFSIGQDKRGNPKLPWSVFTNYPVQGTGADIVNLYRVSLFNRIKRLGWPVLFVTTVHDSVVLDVPKEYSYKVLKLLHEVCDDLIPNIKRLFGYNWTAPLDVEGKMGMNIADMEEVKREEIYKYVI